MIFENGNKGFYVERKWPAEPAMILKRASHTV
jgi:hypothetical protein